MKNIVVLGSTGSIGQSTLDIVSRFPERFRVVGMAAGSDWRRLEKQIQKFRPLVVALANEQAATQLASRVDIPVLYGEKGVIDVATLAEGDIVVSGIVGAAGLAPTWMAIQNKKTIALANKETLVIAGELIMKAVAKTGIPLIPIDSEHAALFQILDGRSDPSSTEINRVILTASGGPLIDMPQRLKKAITPAQATAHPTWKMGAKISVDSATLINKGLEKIEAHWLFGLPPDRIEIMVHRQSMMHAMVEFVDGSVLAQMARPDMRIPIAGALFYPERAPLRLPPLRLEQVGALTFEAPNKKAFPLLIYAEQALKIGATAPAVLNAANEEAVAAFLARRIDFLAIPAVVKRVLDGHQSWPATSLEAVLEADRWARLEAKRHIQKRAHRSN